MTNQDNLAQAREWIEEILRTLDIELVVCVDDMYEGGALSIEQIIGSVEQLSESSQMVLFEKFGIDRSLDLEIGRQQMRNLWESLTSERRNEIVDLLAGLPGVIGSQETDASDALLLRRLIPNDKLQEMSPSDWDVQKENLVDQIAKRKILFLFDQNMGENGSGVGRGMLIISELLSNENVHNVVCCLLTHTVGPDNRDEEWRRLAVENGISRDRFIVIPKEILNDNAIEFAREMKVLAQILDFAMLKTKIVGVIDASNLKARRLIDEIDVLEMDRVVFEVSQKEGLWEPDMLLRIYSLFHKGTLRDLVHGNDHDIDEVIRRLRSIRGLPVPGANAAPSERIRKMQRDELYEPGEYLNPNHLPLEIGDIFCKGPSANSKHYVLVAPQCDLMVRGGGQRTPERDMFPLLEVVAVTNEEDKIAKRRDSLFVELDHFDNSGSVLWFVKLKYMHYVCATVLDACVFNSNGQAVLNPIGTIPNWLRRSWQLRHTRHIESVKSILKPIELLRNSVTGSDGGKAEQAVLKLVLPSGPFKGEVKGDNGSLRVEFNCHRVARCSLDRALGLLIQYTAALSRPAYEPLMESTA